MRVLSLPAAVLAAALGVSGAARAAEPELVLFDTVVDFNRDGLADQAALIVTGAQTSGWEHKAGFAYPLGPARGVELAFYPGAGAGPLDVAAPAAFRLPYLVDEGRFDWVQSLEATAQGSLKVSTAFAPGASDTAEQVLTLVWRKGAPWVAGYTIGWERRDGAGTCDVNLLTGKALLTEGVDPGGPAKRLKGRFKAVPLSGWSEKTRPKVCDGRG